MTEKRKAGRPLKYTHFLMSLDDDELYSPGTIARMGQQLGFYVDVPSEELIGKHLLVRHTLARYRVNHKFPEDGDGLVRIKGQGVSTGWTGERWKSEIEEGQKVNGLVEAERLKELKGTKERVADGLAADGEGEGDHGQDD